MLWLFLLLLGCFMPDGECFLGICTRNIHENGVMNYLPCRDRAKASSQQECERQNVLGSWCCYKEVEGVGNCWVDRRKLERRVRESPRNHISDWSKTASKPAEPLPGESVRNALKASKNLEASDQIGFVTLSAIQTTRGRAKNAFNQGRPTGYQPSISNPYPRCPVQVKMCHRTPCGGRVDYRLEQDPGSCLADSRCCYDYKLAYMRHLVGNYFMKNVPLCYYGATSKQWTYITSFFKPWNSWLTSFILEVFENIFDTNYYSVGGRLVCNLDGQKKAYPVGAETKLQCSLVSGCWDDSLPQGSKCYMAPEFFQQAFGQTEVYPSLYSNYEEDLQCSSNWFDYGPKAFTKLPCAIGNQPSGGLEHTLQWCALTDCCLNYAAFPTTTISQIVALQHLTGVGNPVDVPAIPSGYLSYLLGSSSNDQLSDLFCPFNKIAGSSVFPDFSSDVAGCCDIPVCYHKKKNVHELGPAPFVGSWENWGKCDAACGNSGYRRRVCMVGNRPSAESCRGSNVETCLGKPCSSYAWGDLAQYTRCSVTCGSGYETWKRRCMQNGHVVVSDHYCAGVAEQETRTCNTLIQCQATPMLPSWGEWFITNPCEVTCGSDGLKTEQRNCFVGIRQVPNELCSGNDNRLTRCIAPPCAVRKRYQWFQRLAPCVFDHSTGTYCLRRSIRNVILECFTEERPGIYAKVEPSSLCGNRPTMLPGITCIEADCIREASSI